MTGQPLRSSQVARHAGVNLQTLRYYERRGLLTSPPRSPGGHRLYPPETVTRVRVIKAVQRLGFTLDEVRQLLRSGRNQRLPGTARHSGGAGRDAREAQVASAKLAEIDRRIAELQAVRGELATAMQAECADLASCPEEPSCPVSF